MLQTAGRTSNQLPLNEPEDVELHVMATLHFRNLHDMKKEVDREGGVGDKDERLQAGSQEVGEKASRRRIVEELCCRAGAYVNGAKTKSHACCKTAAS